MSGGWIRTVGLLLGYSKSQTRINTGVSGGRMQPLPPIIRTSVFRCPYNLWEGWWKSIHPSFSYIRLRRVILRTLCLSIAFASELDFSDRILRYDFVKILGNTLVFPAFLPRITQNSLFDKILRPKTCAFLCRILCEGRRRANARRGRQTT